VEIARALPDVTFWLPTKEMQMVVKQSVHSDNLPSNLIVRVSLSFTDTLPDDDAKGLFATTHSSGGIAASDSWKNVWMCPAYKNEGSCGTCRACWNPKVKTVSYKVH